MALTDSDFGEETAQAYANAWLQQLTMSFTPRFRTNLLSPTQDVTIGASSIRQFPERDQD
jgi:hypothetical protein